MSSLTSHLLLYGRHYFPVLQAKVLHVRDDEKLAQCNSDCKWQSQNLNLRPYP